MATRPTIAAVIPCYNFGHFLPETIEGLLAQTVPADEIIVVDDGSTDNSADVAKSYAPRVQHIYRENGGIAAARNTGTAAATSDFLNFMDADDVPEPDMYETLLALLGRFPDAGLVCGFGEQFDDDTGEVVPHPAHRMEQIEGIPHEKIDGDIYKFTDAIVSGLVAGNFLPVPGALVRRSVLDDLGGFDTGLVYGEDCEMWMRVGRAHPIIYRHAKVFARRLHKNNATGAAAALPQFLGMVQLAKKLLATFDLEPAAARLAKEQVTQFSLAAARHYLGEGLNALARPLIADYRRASGKLVGPGLLYALSLVPGALLRLAQGIRTSAKP